MATHAKPRPRPNLFIVGAPKCGTTAWVEYLRTHPDIFFPEIKEPHYFATDLPGMRWTTSLAKYESLFERAGDKKIVGEGSVMYLYSQTAAAAIREYNPHAKVLIFLRPQEDFLPSLHHQYLYRFSEDIEDFEKAWRLSGKRSPEQIPEKCRDPKMLDYAAIGSFDAQVSRYAKAFPPEQIHIVRFAEWAGDARGSYLEILRFLGLEDDGRTDFPPVNEAKSHSNKLLGRLVAHPPKFAEAIVRIIRKITGRNALGLGERAARAIAVSGYRTTIAPALREEIRAAYQADNRKLERTLARIAR